MPTKHTAIAANSTAGMLQGLGTLHLAARNNHHRSMRTRNSFMTILVSATVTGLFTIVTTLLIDHFNSKQKRLLYDTQTSIPFQKDSLNVRIHNLEIQNDGDEIVEAIEGVVNFRDQRVAGYEVKGSPVLSLNDTLKEHDYHLQLGSLNPGEKITLTFLVLGKARVDSLPQVNIRAKGLSAEEKKEAARGNGLPLYKVLLLATLLAVILSSSMVLLVRRHFRRASLQSLPNY